jgi:hypothetical protein
MSVISVFFTDLKVWKIPKSNSMSRFRLEKLLVVDDLNKFSAFSGTLKIFSDLEPDEASPYSPSLFR